MATAFGMTHALPNVMDAMMKRQGDQMVPHVDTGGLHATAAGMVSVPFATTAYLPGGGYLAQEPAAIDYTARGVAATGTAWVCLHMSRSQTVAGWSRQPGTHYLIAPGPTKPTLPANAIWLMQVTTASGVLTQIGDRRHLSGLLPLRVKDVRDYGAVDGGVVDCTAAFNAATHATETWHDDIRCTVLIPPGLWKIDGTVYIRNGQSLLGMANGATKITSTYFLPDGTTPIPGWMFVVGSGFVDGERINDSAWGGIPPEVGCFHVDPGREEGTILTTSAGWFVHDLFLTNAGRGFFLQGADGLVTNCIVDQALEGMVLTNLKNTSIVNVELFLCNYGLTIQSDVKGVNLTNCTLCYSPYAHMVISAGATHITDLRLTNVSFTLNAQYATQVGMVLSNAASAELWFEGCSFRNMKGYAVAWQQLYGTTLHFTHCLFDGERSDPLYDQSTTSGGILTGAMAVFLSNCTFRNLVNPALQISGLGIETALAQVVWDGGRVSHGDLATYIPIVIDNTNPSSIVRLRNIDGGGCQLYTPGVPLMDVGGLSNWLAPAVPIGGRFYVKVPYRTGEVFLLTVSSNTNPLGLATYRSTTTYLVSTSNGYNAGALVHAVQGTLLGQSFPGDTGIVYPIDVQLTFGAGVPSVIAGHQGGGLWYASVPETYTKNVLSVQQVSAPAA